MQKTLDRFIDAQADSYAQALSEVRRGRKSSHWMWYVFPQIAGLGRSATADYYAISGLAEARAYLNHPILGQRLLEISNALLELDRLSAHDIFGSPDDVKLRSSMTLFSEVPGADSVFSEVLAKYFDGTPDGETLRILRGQEK